MSYPIHSLPRGGASRVVRFENDFWGYDPSRNARDRSPARAADTENLIWKGEALGRRNGYSAVAALSEPIYGIYFYGEELLVHAGSNLYRRRAEGAEFERISFSMNPAPSRAVLHHQRITRRWLDSTEYTGWHRETKNGDFLFIMDGKMLRIYDGETVRGVQDGFWGESINRVVGSGGTVSFVATVPVSVTAKTPNNTWGDADPRGENRFSQFRAESFCVSESSLSFRLNCTRAELNTNIPFELRIRDEMGGWHGYAFSTAHSIEYADGKVILGFVSAIEAGSSFSVDEEGRLIRWGEGDYTMAADNSDNLQIIYAVRKDEPEALNTATAMGLFGAGGSDNVLFLGGSPKTPGIDAFSAADDFTCFYETSVESLGSNAAPVTGYCRLTDGRMAVLKNETEGINVYFRNHAVVSVGASGSGEPYQIDAFPSCGGAAVEGCVSAQSVGTVGNEPIFLTDAGLYTVKSVSDTLVNLNQTVHRSKPVDAFLKAAVGEPISICWEGYYLLCFGREALITDGKRESNGSLRFLKWRFSHPITALGKHGNTLWLGDAQGGVYRMDESDSDAGEPFRAFWKAALPEDSAGRRMLLKKLWVSVSPDYQGRAEAVLIHRRCPDLPLALDLRRTDFADWDFGAVCFDGTDQPRWVSVLERSAAADCFSLELCLKEGRELMVFGIRMQYEKGGMMA